MPTLEERMAEVERRLDQIALDQHTINADVAKMPEGFMLAIRVMTRGVNSRIAQLDRKVDIGFAAVDAKFAAVDKRFEAIDNKLDTLSSDVSAILAILGGKHGPPRA